jgi:DNA primase
MNYRTNLQRRRQHQPQQLPLTSQSSSSSTFLRDSSEGGRTGGATTETTTMIPFVIPTTLNGTMPRHHHQTSSSESVTTTTTTTTPRTTSGSSIRQKTPIKMPPSPIDNNNNNNNNMQSKRQYNFIPAAELEQLQASIDIVSLIELYNLPHFHRTNDGDRASCQCPFHDDTNPSLKIDNERGIFKCFSCGVGGTAFKFVQEYSRVHGDYELSFVETVKLFQDLLVPSTATTDGTTNESNVPALPFHINVPMGTRPSILGRVRKKVNLSRSKVDNDNNTTITSDDGDGDVDDNDADESTVKRKVLKQQQAEQRKQRILLANLHAAAYYEECLFSLPSGGSARAHLRSRGINPHTVKAFAIGFAPESYFFPSSSSSMQQQQQRQYATTTVPGQGTTAGATARSIWGEGSLVHHLRDRGFTPGEIVDAGLAIRTKWGKRNENNNDGNRNECSHLMDRFRGRLVIPIFDGGGNNIIGFGGRILEASISTTTATGSNYKAAKYLNSPETLVFQKKNILFGQHMAETITRFGRSSSTASAGTTTTTTTTTQTNEADGEKSLLVVEGYMDAIALWQAGIRETVASMGTALSYEQLTAAAKAARKLNGTYHIWDDTLVSILVEKYIITDWTHDVKLYHT